MTCPIPDYPLYRATRSGGRRLRQNANRLAVSLAHYGTCLRAADVMREPGCTKNGLPVYRVISEFVEYVVGNTERRPENAIAIDGTPLWVSRCR